MNSSPVYFDTNQITDVSPDHAVCEDMVFSCSGGKVAVTALCDGIGAAKFSREAAEEVSRCAANSLLENFEGLYEAEDHVAKAWLHQRILKHMNTCAADYGESTLDRFGTTLLCAAWHEDGRWLVFHCGDGAVLRVKPGGIDVLSTGGVKYYHNLPSNVLGSGTEDWQLLRGEKDDTAAFLLTSDGTEEDIGTRVGLSLTVPIVNSVIRPADFTKVFAWYAARCRERGFRDDISIGWICDRRKTGEVCRRLPAEMRKFILGGLSNPASVERICRIFEIAANREGIALSRLTHQLGYRRSIYVWKRLKPFLKRGLLSIDSRYMVKF